MYLFIRWHAELRERPIRTAAGGCRILRYPVDAERQAHPKLVSLELVATLRAKVEAGDFDQAGKQAIRGWSPISDLLRQWHGGAGMAAD